MRAFSFPGCGAPLQGHFPPLFFQALLHPYPCNPRNSYQRHFLWQPDVIQWIKKVVSPLLIFHVANAHTPESHFTWSCVTYFNTISKGILCVDKYWYSPPFWLLLRLNPQANTQFSPVAHQGRQWIIIKMIIQCLIVIYLQNYLIHDLTLKIISNLQHMKGRPMSASLLQPLYRIGESRSTLWKRIGIDLSSKNATWTNMSLP